MILNIFASIANGFYNASSCAKMTLRILLPIYCLIPQKLQNEWDVITLTNANCCGPKEKFGNRRKRVCEDRRFTNVVTDNDVSRQPSIYSDIRCKNFLANNDTQTEMRHDEKTQAMAGRSTLLATSERRCIVQLENSERCLYPVVGSVWLKQQLIDF